METGLGGKTVVITGAANGIGRATALAFAREGAHVAMLDHDPAKLAETSALIRDLGVNPFAVEADLSTAAGVQAGLDTLLAQLPDGVDVLVNNVGHGDPKPFDEITDEQWERTFAINLMSMVRVTRHLLPVLRQKEKSAIVSNASDLGRQPETAPADYAAMKSAMLALTKSLARAEAPKIRVNAVAPGPMARANAGLGANAMPSLAMFASGERRTSVPRSSAARTCTGPCALRTWKTRLRPSCSKATPNAPPR